MIPREHGTWAMLLVPLVVGAVVAGEWVAEAPLFFLASLGLFLARYPLTVLFRAWIGRTRQSQPRAWRWLTIYSLFSLGLALPLIYPYDRWWLLGLGALSLALLLLSFYLVKERLERTEAGELMMVAGLTLTAPGAYYAGAGHLGAAALYLWLLSFLYFGASVFYVKMRVRHRTIKSRPSLGQRWAMARATILYHLGLALVVIALALVGQVPILTPLAYLPLLGKVATAAAAPAPGMSIRQVGVMEVAHSILFGALLSLAYYGPGVAA